MGSVRTSKTDEIETVLGDIWKNGPSSSGRTKAQLLEVMQRYVDELFKLAGQYDVLRASKESSVVDHQVPLVDKTSVDLAISCLDCMVEDNSMFSTFSTKLELRIVSMILGGLSLDEFVSAYFPGIKAKGD